MDPLQITPQKFIENKSNLMTFLENESNWNLVPLLNVNELHNLQNGRLVKFRGMVQDMHSPEFYLEQYEVIDENTKEKWERCGKYRDILECSDNETINLESPATLQKERQSYIVISIPAVNPWVNQIEEDKFRIHQHNEQSTSSINKRSLDENDMEVDEQATTFVSLDGNKRQCTDDPTTTDKDIVPPSFVISKEHILNFPIPDSKGKVCLLKVYHDSNSAYELKLNTVWDFVGFLSVNPALASQERAEEEDELEFQTHNPPPSLVPRLHCVKMKKITNNNPLVTDEKNAEGIVMSPERMEIIRKELLVVLTQLLLGDELAAEYMICNLLSRVYLRRDYMALGKFCLNISNIPLLEDTDFPFELYKFIELLTTKSHYVPLSLETMNELTLIPKKDYMCNRLTSSLLQLSENTHLVLDETKLSAGKLNEVGVTAVRAFSYAIKNQKCMYDFTYYKIDFECDIPFLVLSEGKSMLPSDCHVVLKHEQIHLDTFKEIADAARHFLKPELLVEIRKYLTLASKIDYELNDNVQKMIQDHFVLMRKEQNATADDLHNLLVLARLVCISQGKSALDESSWKKVCLLEKERRERLKNNSRI